ncbi:MAG: tetratricopeptide repeat protein [Planctomycetota bacterium]
MKTLFLALEGLSAPAFRAALERGALPALDRVVAGGALAELHFPIADARLAMVVSAMTGTWPDEHAILLGETGDPVARTLRPVTAADRARPALWEVLDADGIGSIAVGWPMAITGQTAHAGIVAAGFGSSPAPGQPAEVGQWIHPASLADTLVDCVLRPEDVGIAALSALSPQWRSVDPAIDARPAFLGEAVAENFSRLTAFLELLDSEAFRDARLAALLLSLPGELASLERASEPMADGLLDGLSHRGLELLDSFLVAILGKIPADANLVIAAIPHVETPAEGGMLLISGPAFEPTALPPSVGIPEIAPLVWGACGFRPIGMPACRLTSVLRRELPLLDPTSASPPRLDRAAAAVENLLAVESLSEISPGVPLPAGDRWHLNALSFLSRSLVAKGDDRAALPVLEVQARLLPHVQRAHLLLADCRRRLGLLEEALDSAYAAIDPRHGTDPVALLQAAELEVVLGRPEKARALLDQAAPQVAAYPHHRRQQANILIFLRDWPAAEVMFEALVTEAPHDPWILYRLARCHVARGNWQRAHDLAVASIRLDPNRALVHELLGVALHGLGLVAQARSAFENAARLDPRVERPQRTLDSLIDAMKSPQAEIEDLAASAWQRMPPPSEKTWKP